MSDTGNTIGRLVYTPAPSDAPLWAANPPIVAETLEETTWLAKLHAEQGTAAVIPEVGAVIDETGRWFIPSTEALPNSWPSRKQHLLRRKTRSPGEAWTVRKSWAKATPPSAWNV